VSFCSSSDSAWCSPSELQHSTLVVPN
jgi:hypothetical protein